MDDTQDHATTVAALWEEHRNQPWDPRWNSLEAAGVDLAALETRLAGCTHTWLANNGSLQQKGTATVRLILGQLETVLAALPAADDSRPVWHRLHRTAHLIATHNTPPTEPAPPGPIM